MGKPELDSERRTRVRIKAFAELVGESGAYTALRWAKMARPLFTPCICGTPAVGKARMGLPLDEAALCPDRPCRTAPYQGNLGSVPLCTHHNMG